MPPSTHDTVARPVTICHKQSRIRAMRVPYMFQGAASVRTAQSVRQREAAARFRFASLRPRDAAADCTHRVAVGNALPSSSTSSNSTAAGSVLER